MRISVTTREKASGNILVVKVAGVAAWITLLPGFDVLTPEVQSVRDLTACEKQAVRLFLRDHYPKQTPVEPHWSRNDVGYGDLLAAETEVTRSYDVE